MTHIWVPRTKILEREICPPPVGLAGYYKVEAVKADGRREVVVDWRHNTMATLVVGTEFWATYNVFQKAYIGRDGTPADASACYRIRDLPSFMVQEKALPASTGGVVTSPTPYSWRRWEVTFDPPPFLYPAAELGFGMDYAGGGDWPTRLWMRELFREKDGTPFVYQWPTDEGLTLSYEARLYPFLDDFESFGTIIRACEIDSNTYWNFYQGPVALQAASAHSGDIGAITASPAGSAASGSLIDLTEEEGSSITAPAGWSLLVKKAVWGPTVANFAGGVKSIRVQSRVGSYQVQFPEPIMKTYTDTLSIIVSTPLWAAYAP